MKYAVIAAVTASIALSGCSVAMASKKKGVSIEEATRCGTRTCFLTLRDMQTVSTQTQPDGTTVETYRILLEQGSTGRAVMHGLLDVATLGIWEVAGTPIEGSANKDKFTIITAAYDNTGQLTSATLGDRTAPAVKPAAATSTDDAKKTATKAD